MPFGYIFSYFSFCNSKKICTFVTWKPNECMKPKHFGALLSLMLWLGMGYAAWANNYGLRLKSHDFEGRDRTGMLLMNGDPIDLGNRLTVRFQLDMRSAPVFGNILTVTGDDERRLEYRITLDDNMKTYSPSLRTENDIYSIDYTLLTYDPLSNITASLTLDREKNRIELSFGGKSRVVSYDLSTMRSAILNFGRQMFQLGSLDVAPIDIWDVEVIRDDKQLYFWELRSHRDSISYDRLHHAPALTTSAVWLLDSHTIWQPAFKHFSASELQHAFSASHNELYVVDNDSLTVWNMATGRVRSQAIRGGHRAMRWSKYLYMNERDHMLYSYNLKRHMLTRLDTTTWTWLNPDDIKDEPAYMNHSQMSLGGDTVYTFGGYGFYRYNNDLYRIVTTGEGKVEQLDYSPKPEPRTNMAGAQVGQKLYIFGGSGNEQGKQEIPQVDYADLWEIDLPTMKARKLWETQLEKRLILTSQMVYDEQEQCFYVGTSRKKTAKVWLNEPRAELLGDTVIMNLDFTLLNYSLYKSPSLKKLLLVVDKRMSNAEHHLETYTIDLPILSAEHLAEADEVEGGSKWLMWLVGLLAVAAIAGGVIVWRRRQPKKKEEKPMAAVPAPETAAELAEEKAEQPRFYDRGSSEIRMLGELQVIDRQGEDITAKFTRRTRNLLVMLLLNSVSKDKGIEIRQLDEALWSDMNEEAARNNRNVYMRKLRVLLEEVGNVDITNDKINYKATIGRDVLFDYEEACRLMTAIDEGENDEQLRARILELLLRGPLLPTMSFEWLDDLKGNYSNRALTLLHRLAKRAQGEGDSQQVYRLADAIMAHDPFSEEALAMQCQVLCQRKTVGIAKNLYDKFCKTYEQAMGEPYGRSFADVCKG